MPDMATRNVPPANPTATRHRLHHVRFRTPARNNRNIARKALVYNGPGQESLQERPKPTIQLPGDAIVRITHTTICGTDLHILKVDAPACKPGTVLGHEGVGIVEAVGSGFMAFRAGDRVLVSCISACGRCAPCRKGMTSHCATGR